jgi:hypothetical protein
LPENNYSYTYFRFLMLILTLGVALTGLAFVVLFVIHLMP